MIDRILNATAWGNVSWIELYWCLLMGLGFLLAVYNVFDAQRDRHRLRQSNMNGIAEATVTTSIRGDMLRATELLCGLILGLFGAWAPPSPLVVLSHFYWWYRFVSITVFLVLGNCIVANTIIIQYYRRRVLAMYLKKGGRG